MAKQTKLFHCVGEFECNVFTLKASVFRPHDAENATITGHFGFVFEEISGRRNHIKIVMPLFSKRSLFKMISFHTKTQSRTSFSNSSGVKSFFELVLLVSCLIMFLRYFRNTRGGGWSSDGCELKSSNLTHTVCTCAHLTAFAVLSDLNLQVWLNVVCISIFSFTPRIVRKCGIVPFWIMCRLTVSCVLWFRSMETIRRDWSIWVELMGYGELHAFLQFA